MQKDEEVEFYRQKFAGSQADRIVKAEAEAKKLTEKLKEAKISGSFCFLLFSPPFGIINSYSQVVALGMCFCMTRSSSLHFGEMMSSYLVI